MTELGTRMLRDSIDALETRDVDKANRVREDDDAVDQLYDQVYRELLLYMIEDPRTIQRATYLLWVAHDLSSVRDAQRAALPRWSHAERQLQLALRLGHLLYGNSGG